MQPPAVFRASNVGLLTIAPIGFVLSFIVLMSEEAVPWISSKFNIFFVYSKKARLRAPRID
jgi:hypothetical protein